MEKRRPGYAALGIPEYWRFDQTGDFHETWLAGDRLVEDRYEPIPIETVEEGVLQGYSSVLNLLIRWDHGELRWDDPDTGQHILTYSDLQARANAEQEARMAAEARVGSSKQKWNGGTGKTEGQTERAFPVISIPEHRQSGG